MTQSRRLQYCDIRADKSTYVLLWDFGVYMMSFLFTMTSWNHPTGYWIIFSYIYIHIHHFTFYFYLLLLPFTSAFYQSTISPKYI